MPTYDYQCSDCKKIYELRESFSAPLEHTCEECGKGTAKRLLSAPTIVFKGSGWYVTDSRNKSTAVSDSDNGSSSGDSPAETKTESKSDSGSGSKSSSKAKSKSESSGGTSTETASAAS